MTTSAGRGPLSLSRRIVVNALYSLTAQLVPLLAAIVCIPLLIHNIGVERFGFITLAWALVGYFSVLDLGVSRAMVHFVARLRGKGQEQEIPVVVATATVAVFLLSVFAVLFALGLLALIDLTSLGIPEALTHEARQGSWILILTLPAALLSTVFIAIMEGLENFRLLARVRSPMGVYSFAAPALVSFLSIRLEWVILSVAVGRYLTLLLFSLHLHKNMGFSLRAFSRRWLGRLLRFGGWTAVSGSVTPLLLYGDRFVVTAVLSLGVTAYYTTPFEVVYKLWILPVALMAAVAPAMSKSQGATKDGALRLMKSSLITLSVVFLPCCLIVALGARLGLELWLGPEFAEKSTRVAQLLTLGVAISALSEPAKFLLRAHGRPQLGAIVSLIELALFAAYTYPAISYFGIEGAALAWVLRATIGFVLVQIIAVRVARRAGDPGDSFPPAPA